MSLIRAALTSAPARALTAPHHPDHYLERVHRLATAEAVRARVIRVQAETADASTVELRANGAWRGFQPGQHVEFGVEVGGVRKIRVFSISSSANSTKRRFTVSVKAHPDGFVSQFLHHELKPGTIVYLSQAKGEFTLSNDRQSPLLLVSGGSGITPVMSMVRTLADRDQLDGVTFLHYARSRADEMFTDELDSLAEQMPIERVYTREPSPNARLAGRFTPEHLAAIGIDPALSLSYVCGPAGLIASVQGHYDAIGVARRLRSEYFKVPRVDLSAADATGMLEFNSSEHSAPNTGATILEQAETVGLRPDFGCRMGVCNTCAVKKLSGAVRHVISGETSANTDEIIKPCVNVPVGDVAVAL